MTARKGHPYRDKQGEEGISPIIDTVSIDAG
jgi:hypothetical protein